jgi:nitrogen PTS system EIIA component
MKLTVRDASRLLSVSETELYRWIEDGQIPFHVVNHQPLFNREELLEWATEKHLPVSIELFADEGQMVPLAEALESGGIHYHVGGADRDGALAEVVARLPIDDDDREMVLHIMLAREAQASTGVGRGIAIPHVRTPLVFAGRPAAIALCFLDHAVPFGAIDAAPVTTVFAMMTPTIHGHLQLLSRLSLALHDPGFADAIQNRADKDAILAQARRVDAAMVKT